MSFPMLFSDDSVWIGVQNINDELVWDDGASTVSKMRIIECKSCSFSKIIFLFYFRIDSRVEWSGVGWS